MSNLNRAKEWINYIIEQKGGNNSFQRLNVQMKLTLKGIPIKRILEAETDDKDVKELEDLIKNAAEEFNVKLPETILK